MLTKLILPALVTLAMYISESFCIECKPTLRKYKEHILSLIMGVTLTYVLVTLIPKIYNSSGFSSATCVLIGYSSFVIIHHYLADKTKRLRKIHLWSAAGYHFLSGIILVSLAFTDKKHSILFLIPILFITSVISIAKHNIHHRGPYQREKKKWTAIIALTPLLGGILALLIHIPEKTMAGVMGLVGGMLLFTITREILPSPRSIRIPWFIIGEILFLILLYLF